MLSKSCKVWGEELRAENTNTKWTSELKKEMERQCWSRMQLSTAWPPAGGVANQLGPQHTDRCVYKEGRHTHRKLLGEYLGYSDCLRGIPYLPGSTRKSPNTKDGCSCTVTEKLSFR